MKAETEGAQAETSDVNEKCEKVVDKNGESGEPASEGGNDEGDKRDDDKVGDVDETVIVISSLFSFLTYFRTNSKLLLKLKLHKRLLCTYQNELFAACSSS